MKNTSAFFFLKPDSKPDSQILNCRCSESNLGPARNLGLLTLSFLPFPFLIVQSASVFPFSLLFPLPFSLAVAAATAGCYSPLPSPPPFCTSYSLFLPLPCSYFFSRSKSGGRASVPEIRRQNLAILIKQIIAVPITRK